jgi:hypothetical protein
MVNFWKLLQVLEQEDDAALLDSGEESKAMRVVRTGISLRSNKDCGNFWDDFISVCNDSEGLAELLDVPTEKIGNWATKVKEIVDKVGSADDQEVGNTKSKVVPTGNVPLSSPGGVDTPTDTADTRPMP